MDGDEFIPLAEAVAILGVCHKTVLAWSRVGRFPAFRVTTGPRPGSWRFRRADILAHRALLDAAPDPVPVAAASGWSDPNGAFVGSAAAAALLGVSRRTFTNWAEARRFPVSRPDTGGVRPPLRFRRSDILAYKARLDAVPEPGPNGHADAEEDMTGDLISAAEAAAILAVNRATVLNWAKAGRFPAIQYENTRRTGIYRFRRADILAYRDRSRVVIGPVGAHPTKDAAP